MTQEELIKAINTEYSRNGTASSVVKKFFESHVCIPKGENRHPYADVLHLMAEGSEAEFSSDNGGTWVGVSKALYYCEAYRIKPSEPVHEWQWVKSKDKKEIARSSFFTNDEAKTLQGETMNYQIQQLKYEREVLSNKLKEKEQQNHALAIFNYITISLFAIVTVIAIAWYNEKEQYKKDIVMIVKDVSDRDYAYGKLKESIVDGSCLKRDFTFEKQLIRG